MATCENGPRADYGGYKRKKGSKVHTVVDTLGHLLAVHVTPANNQERAQVGEPAQQVQAVTGETASVAFANQGYGGARYRSSRRQAARGQEGGAAAAPLGGSVASAGSTASGG